MNHARIIVRGEELETLLVSIHPELSAPRGVVEDMGAHSFIVTIDSIVAAIILAPNGDNQETIHRYLSLLCIKPGIILNQLVTAPCSPTIA